MVVTVRTRPRAYERPVSSLAGDDVTQSATREKPSVIPQYPAALSTDGALFHGSRLIHKWLARISVQREDPQYPSREH